jgi:hypothetical protein
VCIYTRWLDCKLVDSRAMYLLAAMERLLTRAMLESTRLPYLYSPIQDTLITGLFLSTISLGIHLAVKRRTSLKFTADDGMLSRLFSSTLFASDVDKVTVCLLISWVRIIHHHRLVETKSILGTISGYPDRDSMYVDSPSQLVCIDQNRCPQPRRTWCTHC